MTAQSKNVLAVILSLGILSAMAWAYVYGQQLNDPLKGKRPNLLILSFCSLRPQHLRAYNPEAQRLPALDSFFASSLVFTNALNGLPWTNITNYIDPGALRSMGYSSARRKSLRIPLVPINKNLPQNEHDQDLSFTDPDVRNYELSYESGFKALKKAITTTKVRPFFFSVHMKYMHFPIIDSVNQKDLWRSEFTRQSASTLDKYLKNPEQYPEKAALLLTLFADPSLVMSSPYVQKYFAGSEKVRIGQIYQVLSDQSLLEAWKNSADYKTDLAILNEGYSLKLQNLDEQLAPVLNLYGRRDLQNETAIVVTGDHGEAFMEDGHFLHSNDIYDGQIRFPLAVKAAGRGRSGKIDAQFSMGLQGKLMQIVADTNADPKVISEYVKPQAKTVYLRNCQGTVDGIRHENKYKLVSDLAGFRLYDIARDPAQMTDLRLELPDDFFKMKELFVQLKAMPRNLLACDSEETRGRPLHSTKKNKYSH